MNYYINNHKRLKYVLFLFFIIQLIIYIISTFFDNNYIDYLNFLSVILSCIMSLYILMKTKIDNSWIIFLALIMTCIADYNLVVIYENFSFAVILFIIAQLLYHLFITTNINNKSLFKIYSKMIPIIILIYLIFLRKHLDFLYVVVFIYIILFIINIIYSIKYTKNYLLIIGLISFILCDICVGSNFLLTKNDINIPIIFKLIWIFYIPSQTLISISSLTQKVR